MPHHPTRRVKRGSDPETDLGSRGKGSAHGLFCCQQARDDGHCHRIIFPRDPYPARCLIDIKGLRPEPRMDQAIDCSLCAAGPENRLGNLPLGFGSRRLGGGATAAHPDYPRILQGRVNCHGAGSVRSFNVFRDATRFAPRRHWLYQHTIPCGIDASLHMPDSSATGNPGAFGAERFWRWNIT